MSRKVTTQSQPRVEQQRPLQFTAQDIEIDEPRRSFSGFLTTQTQGFGNNKRRSYINLRRSKLLKELVLLNLQKGFELTKLLLAVETIVLSKEIKNPGKRIYNRVGLFKNPVETADVPYTEKREKKVQIDFDIFHPVNEADEKYEEEKKVRLLRERLDSMGDDSQKLKLELRRAVRKRDRKYIQEERKKLDPISNKYPEADRLLRSYDYSLSRHLYGGI